MTDKKISELTEITGANTAADDYFVIVDTSADETKKISRDELNNAIEQDALSNVTITGGTIDGTVIGGTTAAAGTFTGLTVESTSPTILNTTGTDGTTIGTLYFSNTQGGSSGNHAGIRGVRTTAAAGAMEFYTKDGGGQFERMQIASNGDISFYEDTGTTAKLFWDASAERLGLGTSSPSYDLNIKSRNTDADGIFIQSSGSDNYGLYIKTAFAGTMASVGALNQSDGTRAGASIDFVDFGRQIAFATNAGASKAERMRIDASGNVGIGTSSPVSTLDSRGDIRIYNNATDVLIFGSALYQTIGGSAGSNDINYRTYANHIFKTGTGASSKTDGTERMRIDSSGNVLVGTTSLSGFQVGIVSEVNAGGGVYSRQIIGHSNTTGSGEKYIDFLFNGSSIGSITQSGTTAVLFNTSSDQRLKENIADADDAGSKVDAIQVRQFDWKADGSHQDYGMIAQELQAVAPEAVSGDANSEEMMGVDYSKLVPMLIKEIQSLRNRVSELEGN